MSDLLITSLQNPKVKRLRSLRLRKYREEEHCYLAEGIRIVEQALDSGAAVENLVYSPELLVSDRARALLERVPADRRLALTTRVFRALSDREDPQGIAAVIRADDRVLDDIPLGDDLLVLVAHQIRDPGNLGALIRTADAVGASGVVVVEPAADLYDPETVRATMGSLYALPIVRLRDDACLAPWFARIRAAGLALLVVASSARGAVAHFEVDYCRPLVLLVGNERTGLPQAMRDVADVVVRLPMKGSATSLNVSAAAAALLYEIVRQRMA